MSAQLIAIDPAALDKVLRRLDDLDRKLDAAEIKPRPEWVSVKDFAALKNVTTRTVHNWIDSGRVQARGAGRLREIKLP